MASLPTPTPALRWYLLNAFDASSLEDLTRACDRIVAACAALS